MGGKNNEEEESMDFYQVLGLEKGCSDADLKNAYKKLALRWHPDRWSALGKNVEAAKNKFQTIQEAYSVLSNANKRFLYDVGVYDTDDDDDENGMADFLNEMAVMMSQNKPPPAAAAENGEETFAELKDLFEEMFQSDIDSLSSSSQTGSTASYSSLFSSSGESYSASNKRASSEMSSNTKPTPGEPDPFRGFCIGTGGGLSPGRGGSSRNARKGSSSSSRKGHR
uniref:dnaJ homolog subfamily B member 6-like isoform X2 n=1 Tax=Erigeron canadensis TaxID=72917 RepID=UPI001CB97581|nr:dnaJ homolog subfamily B member 6-like isoform X2 [Erigeron canadensis]